MTPADSMEDRAGANAVPPTNDGQSPGALDLFFWLGALSQKVFLGQSVDGLEIPAVRLGNYHPLKLIGTGAFGAVFLAHDDVLQRKVALKVAWPGVMLDPIASSRFVEEPRTVAGLNHPGIVKVFEGGAADMLHYIALEHIDGPTLAARLAIEGHLPAREAAYLIEQVARAVHFAHEQGIIHRDLKPSNILLTRRPELPGIEMPVVTDFGLARHSRSLAGGITQSYAVLGTDHYMSPEQAAGRMREVGESSDVFSLGVILFESLTGKKPFEGETAADIHQEISEEPPRWQSEWRLLCPTDLQAIIEKCLQKSPELRYLSAEALADDLGRYLRGEPIKARRASLAARFTSHVRRHPLHFSLGLFSLLIASLLGAIVSNHFAAEKRLATARQMANDADVRERQYRYANKMQALGERFNQLTVSEVQEELRKCAEVAQPFGVGIEWNVLDAMTRAETDAWKAHTASIYQISLSPDGKILASVSKDGHVRLWDWPKKRLVGDLDDGMGEVNCLRFSPDGSHFAYGGDDGRIVIRSTPDQKLQLDLKLSDAVLNELIWLGNGRRIAAGGRAATVYLLDTISKKVVCTRTLAPLNTSVVQRRTPAVESLCELSAPPAIVAGMTPRGGYLLSADTLEIIREIPNPDEPIMLARTFPQLGPYLLTSRDEIRLSKINSLEIIASIPGNGEYVDAIGYSATEKALFVSRNANIETYGIDIAPSPRFTMRRQNSSSLSNMDAMEVTSDGRTVLTGDNTGIIKAWSAKKLATSLDVEVPHGISHISWSPCGRWLAIARGITVKPADLTLFDARSGRRLWSRLTKDDRVGRADNCCFSFHPSGDVVAVAIDDRSVCEYDSRSGSELTKYSDPVKGIVALVQFSPDGNGIVLTDRAGVGYVMDRSSGQVTRHAFKDDGWCIGIFQTCHGDRLVETHPNGDTSLVDISGVHERVKLPGLRFGLNVGAVSPDGTLLAATGDKDIYLWNLTSLDDPTVLHGHSEGLRSLQFSSDGKTLISHGTDAGVWFWNVVTAMPLVRLGDSRTQIAGITVSPDQATMFVFAQVDGRDGLQFFRLKESEQGAFPCSLDFSNVDQPR